MRLNELHDNIGATKKRKRVGRGAGSGRGKTAGRGMKGQKSRSGVAINGFEGGQMPLYMRLPKRGFNNINRKTHAIVNLAVLQKFIDAKKIDASELITEQVFLQSGLVRRLRDGVRILAKGKDKLNAKVNIKVTGASTAAIVAIEKISGNITLSYQ